MTLTFSVTLTLPEQLILQARLGHGEVDDGDLDAHFGQVGWVGHLGCHVELEVAVVVDVTVTQADQESPTLREEKRERERE